MPRWAAADCAAHGLETDWRRVRDNARGCLRTLRVRLTPNLPSESIRFLRHIYHEYAQRTTHGRATDSSIAQAPHRARRSPRALIKSAQKQKETPALSGVSFFNSRRSSLLKAEPHFPSIPSYEGNLRLLLDMAFDFHHVCAFEESRKCRA